MNKDDYKDIINYALDEREKREKEKAEIEAAKKDKEAVSSMIIYAITGLIIVGFILYAGRAFNNWIAF